MYKGMYIVGFIMQHYTHTTKTWTKTSKNICLV